MKRGRLLKFLVIGLMVVGTKLFLYLNGIDVSLQQHLDNSNQNANREINHKKSYSFDSIDIVKPLSEMDIHRENVRKDPKKWLTDVSDYENKIVDTRLKENKIVDTRLKNKSIAMVNTPKWFKNILDSTTNLFGRCEVSSCDFHHDGLNYMNTSDAVILIARLFSIRHHYQPKTKQGQAWIFAVWEPPVLSSSYLFDNAVFRNMINWTMTYRLDSDIPVPYGTAVKKTKRPAKNYAKIMAHKTKLAVQLVSHCKTPSKREHYTKLLEKHLPLTLLGRCGPTRKKNNDSNLMQHIEKSYKFYLAFENSLCRDYMTEKFFKWQNKNMVPIVRGDGKYEYFYPKHSYIDVRDFKSMADLAKYIRYLDRNDTAYIEYLKAKENYVLTKTVGSNILDSLCTVCKMLHNPSKYSKVYPNVHEWFSRGVCREPADLGVKEKPISNRKKLI